MCFCLISSGSKLWGACKCDFALHWGFPSPWSRSEQQEYRWDHSKAVGHRNGEHLPNLKKIYIKKEQNMIKIHCWTMWLQPHICDPQGLLDDPHPTVRSNATLGVCKILAKCWELLPPAIITDFLKKLVMELAGDTSSPDVRCSVLKVGNAFSLFLSWCILYYTYIDSDYEILSRI